MSLFEYTIYSICMMKGAFMADYKKNKKNSRNNITPLPPYRFKVDEFAMRGLNKYRNFLTQPKCDDCGEPGYLQLATKDDVYGLCNSLLQDHGCYESAIFLVFKDGTHAMCVTNIEYNEKTEEPEITGMYVLDGSEVDAFAKLDSDLRLCCYGLMIEHDHGWEICE